MKKLAAPWSTHLAYDGDESGGGINLPRYYRSYQISAVVCNHSNLDERDLWLYVPHRGAGVNTEEDGYHYPRPAMNDGLVLDFDPYEPSTYRFGDRDPGNCWNSAPVPRSEIPSRDRSYVREGRGRNAEAGLGIAVYQAFAEHTATTPRRNFIPPPAEHDAYICHSMTRGEKVNRTTALFSEVESVVRWAKGNGDETIFGVKSLGIWR